MIWNLSLIVSIFKKIQIKICQEDFSELKELCFVMFTLYNKIIENKKLKKS